MIKEWLLIICIFNSQILPGQDYTKYVNPFIGTAENGHTFPGATLPFGLVQVSPQTGNAGWRYTGGYNYEDSAIIGFAQTHLSGVGCSDLGDILLLPFSGNPDREDYRERFLKSTEKVTPGYYAVSLSDSEIDVELTATQRTAFHKYTFRKGNAHLLVDLQSGISWDEKSLQNRVLSANIHIENTTTISGNHRVNVWVTRELAYIIEFNKPFKINKEIPSKPQEKAKRYILDFDIEPGGVLLAKIAISTVNVDGAKKNQATENPGWDFEIIRREANETWNEVLSRVKVKGSQAQKENLYTSLYHLFLQPNNIADVDGKYRGANDSVFTSPSKSYYSTLSLWDTYRAAHPLYTILTPERVDGLVNTLLQHYQVAGSLPMWALWGKDNYCMIGNHAVPVIVDAYLKGFKGFSPEKAYEAILGTQTKSHAKSNWEIYNQLGYYPYDWIKEESVSRTLETCFDDYAVAQMAEKLGKKVDAAVFSKRAAFYKNLFDPGTSFTRGKDSKGNWREPFDVLSISHAGSAGGDYTEGNAWQYTWHVQHDVNGLVKLFGSQTKFLQKLDSLFLLDAVIKSDGFSGDVSGLIGQYAHGNEPSHHVPYLFTLTGKPWRTQELVREITDKFYINQPDGLCGNDDCGQMSAWYLFTAMGFYPVKPVSGEYVFGAPQLPEISISLPDNKQFIIEAKNISDQNKYVKSISLNGKPYSKLFITHQEIMKGGHLVFTMGTKSK
jgi:predicted alpha-1,2-mannosidase